MKRKANVVGGNTSTAHKFAHFFLKTKVQIRSQNTKKRRLTNPPQLTIIDKMSPSLTPVLHQRLQRAAVDAVCHLDNCCADDVVASADGEGLVEVRCGYER